MPSMGGNGFSCFTGGVTHQELNLTFQQLLCIVGGFSPAVPEFNESIEASDQQTTLQLSTSQLFVVSSADSLHKLITMSPRCPLSNHLEDSQAVFEQHSLYLPPTAPRSPRPKGWVPDDVKTILSPEDGLTIIINGPLLAIKLPQPRSTKLHATREYDQPLACWSFQMLQWL